jgi:Fe2+ or Zn2+ uptake regulation protein
MGKSHENVLNVLHSIDEYTKNGDSFFTVKDLFIHMRLSEYPFDMSKKTVRRILKEVEKYGVVEHREIGNQTVYIVEDEDLVPSVSKLYN